MLPGQKHRTIESSIASPPHKRVCQRAGANAIMTPPSSPQQKRKDATSRRVPSLSQISIHSKSCSASTLLSSSAPSSFTFTMPHRPAPTSISPSPCPFTPRSNATYTPQTSSRASPQSPPHTPPPSKNSQHELEHTEDEDDDEDDVVIVLGSCEPMQQHEMPRARPSWRWEMDELCQRLGAGAASVY